MAKNTVLLNALIQEISVDTHIAGDISKVKGGDPAAGSPTATLLRLHPSH